MTQFFYIVIRNYETLYLLLDLLENIVINSIITFDNYMSKILVGIMFRILKVLVIKIRAYAILFLIFMSSK